MIQWVHHFRCTGWYERSDLTSSKRSKRSSTLSSPGRDHKLVEIGSSALSSKRLRDDNGEQYGRNVGSARGVKLQENRTLLEKESRK